MASTSSHACLQRAAEFRCRRAVTSCQYPRADPAGGRSPALAATQAGRAAAWVRSAFLPRWAHACSIDRSSLRVPTRATPAQDVCASRVRRADEGEPSACAFIRRIAAMLQRYCRCACVRRVGLTQCMSLHERPGAVAPRCRRTRATCIGKISSTRASGWRSMSISATAVACEVCPVLA